MGMRKKCSLRSLPPLTPPAGGRGINLEARGCNSDHWGGVNYIVNFITTLSTKSSMKSIVFDLLTIIPDG